MQTSSPCQHRPTWSSIVLGLLQVSACTFSTLGQDARPEATDSLTSGLDPSTSVPPDITSSAATSTDTLTTEVDPVTTGTSTTQPLDECTETPCTGTDSSTGAESPVCGDGTLQAPEECDDGNAIETDSCLNSCKLATCGDAVVHQGVEQCDDGNATLADTCWPTCELSQCGTCEFPRPNVLFILDYSSSMNEEWDGQETRFTGVVSALRDYMLESYNVAQRIHPASMRFGHDPDPDSDGTKINIDNSGLLDGQKLDLPWLQDLLYVECQHEAFASLLDALPSPSTGSKVGIGAWTRGAFIEASGLIHLQRTILEEDVEMKPAYRIVLITDGPWTDPKGMLNLMPEDQNPIPTIEALNLDANVKTYVISLGDALGAPFADEMAAAGGTGAAKGIKDSSGLSDALTQILFIDAFFEDIIPGSCSI